MNETRKEITEKDVFLEKHLKEVKMNEAYSVSPVISIEWEEFLLARFMKEDMGIDCKIKLTYKIGIILIYD